MSKSGRCQPGFVVSGSVMAHNPTALERNPAFHAAPRPRTDRAVDMRNVTEQSVDQALTDVWKRLRKARRANDVAAEIVLEKQLNRLLDLRLAERRPPMIAR